MGFTYSNIPKTKRENILYRQEVIQWGAVSKRRGASLWSKCADGPDGLLFWINTFCWLHEPRAEGVKVIPFISYPYQDEGMVVMQKCVGKRDICILKTRDMGVSWMLCMVFLWRFIFKSMESLLLVSRRQVEVDSGRNSASLFWKLIFQLERQPSFLRPLFQHIEMELANETNGSLINGEATTGNIGRGGRRTAIGIDEFAAFPITVGYDTDSATRDVTKSRFFNSTPQGMNNAYADFAHMSEDNIIQLRFHWSIHPEKKLGRYQAIGASLKIIDDDYKFPENYPFILDGKLRSPWYDNECRRSPNDRHIAQELDMDFIGSNFSFFSKDMLDTHEQLYVQPHVHRGDLNYDKLTGECVDVETGAPVEMPNGTDGGFVEDQENGALLLWCHIPDGRPSQEVEYVIGADVSAGAGASNSCLSVFNVQTGDQVAEYACATINPSDFGVLTAALGRWFGGIEKRLPAVIAESNGGHNRHYHKSLLNVGYGTLYYRRNEQDTHLKISTVPGWGSTKENKRELFEEFSRALGAGDIQIRSRFCLDETRVYVYSSDGKTIEYAGMGSSVDPTGAKENHGDRTMAAALALKALHTRSRQPKAEPKLPVGSLAWRRKVQDDEDFAENRDGVLVNW